MHPFIEKMVQLVQNTPPSCLSGFQVSSCDSEPWNDWAAWSLTCGCSATKGKVLGYPLKDFDPEYKGRPLFISPLAFLCSSCGKTTEIVDTELHGYNAEIEKMSEHRYPTLRGTGERTAIPCPHCQTSEFSVKAFCAHPHFDLIEDEPELEPRVQEFFDSFDCHGVCASCGKESSLANFELA
jgi:hypothetical protein